MALFYSFFLLLLLLCETQSLYIREPSPKDQATQCFNTTETLFWRTTPDPAIENDVEVKTPTTVTRRCRDLSLRKRQVDPNRKGKNIFNAICQRERTGRRGIRQNVVDVIVPVNDQQVTEVETPMGGTIDLRATQGYRPQNPYQSLRFRPELVMTITNRSPCPVSVEWITRLRVIPEFPFQTPQILEGRSIEGTSRDHWEDAPNECEIGGISPVVNTLTVLVRLLIEAFGCPLR